MSGASAALREVVRGPHAVDSRAEVLREGVVVRTLAVHAGRVDADRTAAHLRRFAASVADPTGELTPYQVRDLLAPFGTEVRLYRGARIPKVIDVTALDDTAAQWATGTHTGTGVDPAGALVLGVGQLSGTRVSTPLALAAGSPVAGSRISWQVTGAALVETSVDNGASWQPASNLAPVPRLRAGATSVRAVLSRVTLSRTSTGGPTPVMGRLLVQVALDSSVDELCALGHFTLNDTDISDSARGLVVSLSGADLSRRVARNSWDETLVIDEGTNFGTAIQTVIANRMPTARFNFASTERTTPRLFFGEQSDSADPWADAQTLAKSIGYYLYFDVTGTCTLRPTPDPETSPSVWTFTDQDRPTIIEIGRRVTDENTYNRVIVQGEGTSNTVPVSARWEDDDPTSPMYIKGPYGAVTKRFRDPSVTSVEQAQDAANAMGLAVKGATEVVRLQAVVAPFIEPLDVVEVRRDRSRIVGRFAVDTVGIPLGAKELMDATCRRQRQ